MLFSILLLALSVSIDALGVGTVYGMRKISIPLTAKLLMCFFSMLYSGAALIAGRSLSSILPPSISKSIGVLILGVMGVWIIIQALIKTGDDTAPSHPQNLEKKTIFEIVIKSLGITIQIIKNPLRGDIDRSGVIDTGEAFLLGLALSVDAIGAGLGSGLAGIHSALIPVTIALFQLAFMYTGIFLGHKFSMTHLANTKGVSVIPGILLILLAILRIYQ